MYKFVLKRLVMLIPVLLGVSFIVFSILSFTPGDPVEMRLGDNYSEEAYNTMKEEMGLNDPFLVRYVKYIADAVRGDFGTSYKTSRPVVEELAARLPNTILLSVVAMCFAILVGIPLGSLLHAYVMAQVKIDMLSFDVHVEPVSYLIGILITFVFAFLVNLVMQRKLSHVSMTESLKSIE